MADLAEFLVRLTREPDLVESFRSDPSSAMSEAGLSQDHQDVLMRGEPSEIEAAVDPEHPERDAIDFNAFASWFN